HHEQADEYHRRYRADPIEVTGCDAVLRARRRHADDFLRAEIGGDECQPADPRRHRAACLKKVLAGLRVTFEDKSNGKDESKVHEDDDQIDERELHAHSTGWRMKKLRMTSSTVESAGSIFQAVDAASAKTDRQNSRRRSMVPHLTHA